MAVLTTKQRKLLHSGSFALPGRRYPINDENHARNALARVSQYGTESEKERVRSVVHRKFPGIGKADGGTVGGSDEAVSCSGGCALHCGGSVGMANGGAVPTMREDAGLYKEHSFARAMKAGRFGGPKFPTPARSPFKR